MKKYKYLHHNPTKNTPQECLYACETPISGQIIVRIQTGNTNNYTLFPSLGDYVDAFPPQIPHNTHEIIPEHWPQKPKFDLDGGTDFHHAMIIDCIRTTFAEEYGAEPDILAIESDFPGNTKLSKHVIITDYSFENSREAAAFTDKVLTNIREIAGDDDPDMVACIDAGVNKPNQSFRMPLATNLKGRKLILPAGREFHLGVVTFTEFTRRLPSLIGIITGTEDPAAVINTDEIGADLNVITAFNIDANIFAHQSTSGNMINYSRISASHCNLCGRTHDAGGNGIFFVTLRHEIRQYCYANKEKKYNSIPRAVNYISFQEARQALHQRKYDTIATGYAEVITAIKPFVMLYEAGITMVAVKNKDTIRLFELGTFIAKECGAHIYAGEKKIKFATIIRNNESKLFYHGGLVFNPSPNFSSPNTINLFTKFATDPQENPALIAPILAHILNIWANGDDLVANYILDWLAGVIQGKKIGTALVLFSKRQGAGKNIITDFLLKMIGSRFATSCNDLDQLLSKFNAKFAHKVLTILNEANNIEGGAYNKSFDKLKDLITTTTINLEKKGIDSTDIDDFNNYIFTTNNERPIKVEQFDRRYTMLQMNEARAGDTQYFDSLIKCLNAPGAAEAMMFFLANRQITQNIHMSLVTEWKQNLQELHKPSDPIATFVEESEYIEAEQNSEIVYEHYKMFCGKQGEIAIKKDILAKKLKFYKFIQPEIIQKKVKGEKIKMWIICDEYVKHQVNDVNLLDI